MRSQWLYNDRRANVQGWNHAALPQLCSVAASESRMSRSQNVRDTSIDAYRTVRLGDQQHRIVAFLAKHAHTDFTRHELSVGTGISVNAVAGRVAELLKLQIIEERPRRPDRHTKVAAHPLTLAPLQAELFAA
jgi:hypothetical protein